MEGGFEIAVKPLQLGAEEVAILTEACNASTLAITQRTSLPSGRCLLQLTMESEYS